MYTHMDTCIHLWLEQGAQQQKADTRFWTTAKSMLEKSGMFMALLHLQPYWYMQLNISTARVQNCQYWALLTCQR